MMPLISFIVTLSATSFAAPSCPTAPKSVSGIMEACNKLLPKCIETGKHFDGPEKAVDVIKNLTKDSSDDELFTRLIYAESLASGCNLNDPAIYESIAWTLKNRVASGKSKIYGSGRGVILHPGQFSSSTGPCDVAKRAELLCPSKDKNFELAWAKASQAWSKTKTGKNPIPTVRHYFFPHHFDSSTKPNCAKWKGVYPTWAKKENAVKEISNCAIFYNVKE